MKYTNLIFPNALLSACASSKHEPPDSASVAYIDVEQFRDPKYLLSEDGYLSIFGSHNEEFDNPIVIYAKFKEF